MAGENFTDIPYSMIYESVVRSYSVSISLVVKKLNEIGILA